VEGGALALHGLLDHRAPEDLLVLAHQRLDRVDQQLEDLGLLLVLEGDGGRFLRAAHQVLVEDELVAVVDQQIARGVLHADADDVLVVLLQLGDERGEVGVAGGDDEEVDVLLGPAHVHGVDGHADVRGVLAGVGAAGNLDQLDGRLVQLALVVGELVPVAVGAFDDDFAFLQQALEQDADFEFLVLGVDDADGDVLEVDEQSDLSFDVVAHIVWWRRSAVFIAVVEVGFARHAGWGSVTDLPASEFLIRTSNFEPLNYSPP